MHEVTWETTLYQPVFRKLVNESWQTFRALQKASRDEEGREGTSYKGKGNVFKQVNK